MQIKATLKTTCKIKSTFDFFLVKSSTILMDSALIPGALFDQSTLGERAGLKTVQKEFFFFQCGGVNGDII